MSKTQAKQSGTSARLRKTRAPGIRPEVLADLDTQLMMQVREGNDEAGNMLVRRNFARVVRYITRLVRARHQAEDLAQDVFLQVLTHAQRYEPTAKFSTWLYRIATNTALNYLNQAYVKRRRDPDPEEGTFEFADEAEQTPEQQMNLDELRSHVAEAVNGLPVNQRVALTLYQKEDLSYEQIAQVLDVSVESVRALLKRARESLRSALRDLM